MSLNEKDTNKELASVEGIFLSTFFLITQNRMSAHADKRAEKVMDTMDKHSESSTGNKRNS